ncbi:MAG TPA: hypothetical protein VFV86_06430 [Nitrososphaeraceae archaeon]|nr:hypothetical protein [Nitrososphaeraceae archaeon]
MKVVLQKITFKKFLNCFSNHRDHKYSYIGIDWNIFKEGTECYNYLEEFIKYVAKQAKPWWCPKWFLNLLHLYGNDNSIVRCRSQKISRLHRRLTKGIMITDIKEKWGTLRVYGYFTKDIQDRLDKLEELIDPYLEPY